MKLTLTDKIAETHDVFTFIFQPEQPVAWQAGQFLEYSLPHEHADNRGTRRWFTNSAAPHEGFIQITTRISEPSSTFKQALFEFEPGSTIEATEPDGDFVVQDSQLQYVFIAGGIGITPFRAILTDLHHRSEPLNITLLYGARSEEDVVFRAEFDAIVAQHPELDIHFAFGPTALTESFIRDAVPRLDEPLVYLSGPEPMVESLGNLLLDGGVPKQHLKQDFFPNYSKSL